MYASTSATSNAPATTLKPSKEGSSIVTDSTDSPSTVTRGPVSTDGIAGTPSAEAFGESTSRDTPIGGLQVIGLAAAAVLVGLFSLIRRRIINDETRHPDQEPRSTSGHFIAPEGHSFCVECGHQNHVDNRFCSSCGADLAWRR